MDMIIDLDSTARPTATTLSPWRTGVSDEMETFLPHQTTWRQKTDLPCCTKGLDSSSISRQLCLNVLLLSSICAKYGDIARPPSILSVHRSRPSWYTLRIRRFFLESVMLNSFGRYLDTPLPNSASIVCLSFRT